jgi:hypothetical protein
VVCDVQGTLVLASSDELRASLFLFLVFVWWRWDLEDVILAGHERGSGTSIPCYRSPRTHGYTLRTRGLMGTHLKVMRPGSDAASHHALLVRREVRKLVMQLVSMAKQHLWMRIRACSNTRMGRPLCDGVGIAGVPEPSAGWEVE